MKGVVFTEFLGFVAGRHGEAMVDDIIDASGVPSGGAYTTVGTYDHAEIVALIRALTGRTGEDAGEVLRAFGRHLSTTFAAAHPAFFARSANFFDFLDSVEAHIHVEVRKLYPDAELPSFTVVRRGPTRMVLDYRSPRRMEALAEGLIVGSARHFGVEADVRGAPVDDAAGPAVRFVIDVRPIARPSPP